jgi:hypothetical protein
LECAFFLCEYCKDNYKILEKTSNLSEERDSEVEKLKSRLDLAENRLQHLETELETEHTRSLNLQFELDLNIKEIDKSTKDENYIQNVCLCLLMIYRL